jgi:uracil-DNA glycosylase family 4
MPNFVAGEGPKPCNGMILGEAPGAEEDRQGRPFVGASGALLEEALHNSGIGREQVYITNAYKYRPEDNRTPTEDEIAEHREKYLWDELLDVDPKVMLLLGNVALWTVTGDKGITSKRGEWYYGSAVPDGATLAFANTFDVMPTWHPSYVLRNGRGSPKEAEFMGDVEKFVRRMYQEPDDADD